MINVVFKDNSFEVKEAINDVIVAWLYETAGELESKTKRTSPVDTGQLKGSWGYNVDEEKGEATIGSPLENAIWNEFGTGQYALNGNGRKNPWAYKDAKGEWHKTSGKRPRRTLFNAFESSKGKFKRSLETRMKGLN